MIPHACAGQLLTVRAHFPEISLAVETQMLLAMSSSLLMI